MSVVIETTLGDVTVDLFLDDRPRACLNFLKLCKMKYYNFNLFHTISRGFIAQTGDPTGSRTGGESIFGLIDGPSKRYFEAENKPRIKHTRPGLLSFVGGENNMVGSQFFLTLGDDLTYLDDKHCVFGEVVEGFDVLEAINEVICDKDDRPYQDVRITHTVVLDDPYKDPEGLGAPPSRSPSPSAERLKGGRIAPDENIDEASGKSAREVAELQAEREAKARATILEMIGDIPDAEMAPPENVLFVCKLNPVTTDDDLEIIFSRFGRIKSCEVIRDRKSGDSLQYAFVEFEDQKACEEAYFKMDNVLIDDRRIHVDFSQSVSKVKWLGKGRGVAHLNEEGMAVRGGHKGVGGGDYKYDAGSRQKRGGTDNKEPNKRFYGNSPSRTKRRSPERHRRDRDRQRSPEDRRRRDRNYEAQSRRRRIEDDERRRDRERPKKVEKSRRRKSSDSDDENKRRSYKRKSGKTATSSDDENQKRKKRKEKEAKKKKKHSRRRTSSSSSDSSS